MLVNVEQSGKINGCTVRSFLGPLPYGVVTEVRQVSKLEDMRCSFKVALLYARPLKSLGLVMLWCDGEMLVNNEPEKLSPRA